MKKRRRYTNGAVLIEVFIAMTLLVILMTGSLSLIFPAVKSAQIGRQRVIANLLLWEQEEAVRQVRNEAWANLTPGTYYAVYNPTSNPPTSYQGWQLVPGTGIKNNVTEQITISNALRVNTNQLSDTLGSSDANTKKVVCQVQWTSFGATYTLSLTTYITDWQPF